MNKLYNKNLIVGCGSQIENIYGGLSTTGNAVSGWYPLKFHQHKNSITIDIDPRARPDILIDICTQSAGEIVARLGYAQFEFVALENLPISIFLNKDKIHQLARNVCLVTSPTGVVLIPRAFDTQLIINSFSTYGMEVKLCSLDPELIYKYISTLTNNNADEYIANYNNNSNFSMKARNSSMPYILFNRKVI